MIHYAPRGRDSYLPHRCFECKQAVCVYNNSLSNTEPNLVLCFTCYFKQKEENFVHDVQDWDEMDRWWKENFKCHSCSKSCNVDNPCVWIGLPTYCKPCYERIVAEGNWKGLEHYRKTGEEYPK